MWHFILKVCALFLKCKISWQHHDVLEGPLEKGNAVKSLVCCGLPQWPVEGKLRYGCEVPCSGPNQWLRLAPIRSKADKQIWYAVAYYSDQWELNRQRGGRSQRYAVAYYSDRWEPNEQRGGRSQRYAVAYYSDRWEPMNKESQKFKTISFMNTPVRNLISYHALNSVVSSKTLLQKMKKSSSSHALFFTHQHHWMLQPDSFSHLSPILVMNQRHPWAKSLQPIAEAAKFLGTCAPVFPLWSRSGRDPFWIHTTLSWWTILASSTSSKFS